MAWQVTTYTAPMLGAALIAGLLAIIAFWSRGQRTAVPLIGVLVGTTIWCGASGLQISSTELGAKLFWRNLRFLGTTIAVPSVFFFAASFTNREQWLTRRRVALVLLPEVLVNVAVWTNPADLFRASAAIRTDLPFRAMEITFGPLFYAEAVYQYLLLVAMSYWLLDEFRRSRKRETDVYQSQAGLVLVAIVVPWIVNVGFVAGVTEVDLTPLGFVATGILFAVGFFRYQILDLVPIARSTVVDNINEGYLVLNTEDVVVDVNETAVDIIDAPKEALVGTSFRRIFSDYPTILERFEGTRESRGQIAIDRDGRRRYYDVTVSGISNRRNRDLGRVVLFRDVTERERRKRQLEQQNERLEDFAQIVSHDLRNPLSVARGRVELLEAEQTDVIEQNLDRMGDIIDDTLTLARQGQTVDETEPVDLAELAAEAWENVETEGANREFTVDRTVAAHRGRLRQVFENLFRNAVEHGSTGNRMEPDDAAEHGSTSPASGARQDAVEDDEVTVRVDDTDGGFYVADDGDGIPAEERERVVEKGYTTATDGTGFGLAIVQMAVEGHGWDLDIGESDAGGARFEITGVDDSPFTDD